MKIGLLGAGSWGTALAQLLAENGHEILLWCYEPEVAHELNHDHTNRTYLPDISLASTVRATIELEEVALWGPVMVSVLPSHVVRPIYRQLAPYLRPEHSIISCTKGIENGSLALMHQVIAEFFPWNERILALSGPSFAAEVVRHKPTAVVIASPNLVLGHEVQQIFATPWFRTYFNPDLLGVELCGALKNVMAIASGMVIGAELGVNAMAALITRGLHELTQLGLQLGARAETFSGLSGMGDLILTCTGTLSRNRGVGVRIGQGESLSDILASMTMVAEGVQTTRSARDLAHREGIEMPIVEQVFQVLHENKSLRQGLAELMVRRLRDEGGSRC